ncbi:unnamed protein product [Dibothriocephalus latus]|uniref:RRM domain-containing protein n=1 Tax=Dibothriocephalus latus TaxID=60516 RepID=A0A3P6QL07_DIBLA|nr:unnamed protein product [Dibothriocephalus latus]
MELHVDGVKSFITKEDLQTYFSRFGEDEGVIMNRNPVTNRYCGDAFIYFAYKWDEESICMMHHHIRGVQINVKQCISIVVDGDDDEYDDDDDSDHDFSVALSTSAEPNETVTLDISGAYEAYWKIRRYFEQFGNVVKLYLRRHPVTNWHYGRGFVKLRTTWNIETLIAMEHVISGVKVHVELPR